MKNVFENINDILSKWDPLNVGKIAALDEYRAYVPQIVKEINSKERLINCLEDIVIYKLETGYDRTDKKHTRMLNEIADKILEAT